MEECMLPAGDLAPVSRLVNDVAIWDFMEAEDLLASTLTLRELLRRLHDPKRILAEKKRSKRRHYCCACAEHNSGGKFSPESASGCEYIDVNSNHRTKKIHRDYGEEEGKYHGDCARFAEFKLCKQCSACQNQANASRTSSDSSLSLKEKQKKDRETIRQKLSMGDPEIDSPQGTERPWYQMRNNQNLQICYINDSCSSSESEDNGQNASSTKTSPLARSSSASGRVSPTSSPVLSSPGFGMRKNFPLIRMQSSSSTVSLSSTSSAGHRTSLSSIPGEGEIISVRSSIQSDDIPKIKTRQEQLELEARIAITQAHQDARRQAEEERRQNRKGGKASMERLLQVPLDDATRLKVKTRTLDENSCHEMTLGQLQVILNEMHAEKEALNSELKDILEVRDELRTEQDAKLVDVEDMKAMLSLSGPETTV